MDAKRFILRALLGVVLSPVAATAAPQLSAPPTGVVQGAASTAASPPLASPATQSSVEPPQLVVADGQLTSHLFQVFVTYPVTAAMNPILHLTGANLLTKPGSSEGTLTHPRVAPGQHRMIDLDGVPASAEGTLLMFDAQGLQIPWYKSSVRLLPDLEWTEPAAEAGKPPVVRHLVAKSDIYIGSMLPGAVLWTVITVGVVVVALWRWSVTKSKKVSAFKARPWLLLITGPDGYLSLWRAQLAVWTVAVGGVVLLFGLLRLHVPQIPETLVALMGMSLLTGTVSAAQAKQDAAQKQAKQDAAQKQAAAQNAADADADIGAIADRQAPAAPAIKFNEGRPEWADLISVGGVMTKQGEQPQLSMPKAQMVFWTVIILTLFIVKSVLLGALWPVPWEMVALTGFSQAGYIGDKYIQSRP